MARNLSRNTRVYASTLDKASLLASGALAANTYEIKVLDGYSFSQDTSTQDIQINEAGTAPVRGSRSFNTALNPADVSFSTYVRPYIDGSSYGDCVEKILWASAMGTLTGWNNSTPKGSETAPSTFVSTNGAQTESMTFSLATSNSNELMDLTLIFVLDNTAYVVEDFNVGTAEVDFSIDGIATINWSGQGSKVEESEAMFAEVGTWTGTNYTAAPATTANSFIRNKLSTITLQDQQGVAATGDQSGTQSGAPSGQTITTSIGISTANLYDGGRVYNTQANQWAIIVSHTSTGTADTITVSSSDDISTWVDTNDLDIFTSTSHANVSYNIPITGATLTLENNFSYLTPEELAVVNLPLAGFAGARATSGSFTAYLNTGGQGSAGLLQDLLAKSNEVSNEYNLVFNMGGTNVANPRVKFTIPHAQIGIPTTNVEDVLTTEITFSAQPWDATNDLASFEDTNEITIQYLPAT